MIPLLVVLCHILRLVLCYISVDSFQSGGCPFADWIFGRGFSNSVCWSISGFGSSDMHQLGATIYASQDHPDGNPQHSNGSFDLFVALEGAMCIFRWCRSNSVAAVCWIGRPGWAHALCLLVDQNIQKLASPLRPTHTHSCTNTPDNFCGLITQVLFEQPPHYHDLCAYCVRHADDDINDDNTSGSVLIQMMVISTIAIYIRICIWFGVKCIWFWFLGMIFADVSTIHNRMTIAAAALFLVA